MEFLELPQDIIWDGNQSPMLSPTHLSNASTEQVLIFEDNFANGKQFSFSATFQCKWLRKHGDKFWLNFQILELIPNDDDLMKPNQEMEIVFSPDDFDFEQFLEVQQQLDNLETINEEENQINGECKNSLMIEPVTSLF